MHPSLSLLPCCLLYRFLMSDYALHCSGQIPYLSRLCTTVGDTIESLLDVYEKPILRSWLNSLLHCLITIPHVVSCSYSSWETSLCSADL